jgi:A/G-specific adenine glycosylase
VSDTTETKALRRKLLRWYRANRRDLPWRRTSDPYAIWLSESMLQQTRVETVIPYWERFLARFPTVEALARAPLDDVLTLWAGLGYYSRARNLHRAAQVMVESHGGAVPEQAEALRALPGVGRYTAGAVASIAFDRAEPIVDGNVARVFARVFGIDEDVKSTPVVKRLWEEAAELVHGASPGDFNQALMELGATVCVPRGARCLACPVSEHCIAFREGRTETLPRKTKKLPPRPVSTVAGWLERRGQVLVVQRPAEGLLGGLWELPGGDLLADEEPASGLVRCLRDRVGLNVPGADELGTVEHLFSHLRMRVHVFHCKTPEGRVRRRDLAAHRWIAPGDIDALAIGGPTRKALRLLRQSR